MAPATRLKHHYGHDSTHPLTEFNAEQEFLCDGCKSTGNGKRLRCGKCDFDLHPFCANCPMELSSFMHPAHPIPFFMSLPTGGSFICYVCGDDIDGALYLCSSCDFGFHPCCSQIPRYVKNENLDPTNPLELQPPVPNRVCDLCKGGCELRYWWYRSVSSDADAHFWCLNGTKEPDKRTPVVDPAEELAAAQVEAYFSKRGREAALSLISDDYEYVYEYKRSSDYI